jgi:hypothetical protein
MENLAPLFAAVMTQKKIEAEYSQSLASEYRERTERYREIQPKLDLLLQRVRRWSSDLDLRGRARPHSPALLQFVAADQPMLPPMKRRQMTFNDQNRLCGDPVLEHERFKRRIVWTEKEVGKFLEKYARHPKQFRRIARDLPGKSVKDLVEFYYLMRFELNLKEVGGAAKRRAKMKVVSEGMVRRAGP